MRTEVNNGQILIFPETFEEELFVKSKMFLKDNDLTIFNEWYLFCQNELNELKILIERRNKLEKIIQKLPIIYDNISNLYWNGPFIYCIKEYNDLIRTTLETLTLKKKEFRKIVNKIRELKNICKNMERYRIITKHERNSL